MTDTFIPKPKKEKRINVRVSDELLKEYKEFCDSRSTTISQRLIDHMVSDLAQDKVNGG